MNLKYELTQDWRKAWKWLQVQAGLLILVAPELYAQSDQIQALLPPSAAKHVMALLGFLVMLNAMRKKAA